MFRRRVVQFGFAALYSSPLLAFSEWSFDRKGFDATSPQIQSLPAPQPLSLAGVGMRRKNLYLVDIDVYLASISLSPSALSKSKAWMKTKEGNSVADAIIGTREGGSIPQPIAIVTLRFQRDVDAQTFVLGFNDVFAGLPADQLDVFQQKMKASIGTGAKKGDDICLVWMEGGSLIFLKNGQVGQTFINPVFEKRLLEAYVDAKRAVSPELIKSIDTNIPNM